MEGNFPTSSRTQFKIQACEMKKRTVNQATGTYLLMHNETRLVDRAVPSSCVH